MLSKNQVKLITSLAIKKFRAEHGLFIAEGVKVVDELLRSSVRVKQVFATAEWLKARGSSATGTEADIIEISAGELERISQLTTPQQVLAVAEIPHWQLDPKDLENKLTLALDDMRDPGNLGTIIRIADWFGISDVVCSSSSADAWNPKVVQSTMGSISRVRVHYTGLEQFISGMRSGFSLPVYGAVLGGESIYSKELSQRGLIVIGNESKGISGGVMEMITDKITIPSYSKGAAGGEAESLNAAIATAVICAEFRRRIE